MSFVCCFFFSHAHSDSKDQSFNHIRKQLLGKTNSEKINSRDRAGSGNLAGLTIVNWVGPLRRMGPTKKLKNDVKVRKKEAYET